MVRALAIVAFLVLLATPATAAGDARLAGQWHMDEVSPSGLTPDSSGNGNQAVASDASLRAGRFGQTLTNDFNLIRVHAPAAALEPAKVTVLAWVKGGSNPGPFKYVVGKGAEACTGASYALYTGTSGDGDGRLRFYVDDGPGFTRSPAAPASVWDDQWHAVAGTFDGATVRLFVDGTEVGSGTPASGSAVDYGAANHDFDISSYPNEGTSSCAFSTYYLGERDEVRVYDGALTASEVQTVSTGAALPVPAGPPPAPPAPPANSPPVNAVPVTSITSGRRNVFLGRRVRLRFASSAPGTRFTCRLDRGAVKPCTSPYTTPRLRVGPHVLRVFATSATGVHDANPVSLAFQVFQALGTIPHCHGKVATIVALPSAGVAVGTPSPDVIVGRRNFHDEINAGGGDDTVCGRGGGDTLIGGGGHDYIQGGQARIRPSSGVDDQIYGGMGRDVVYGQGDDDRLVGGTGADELHGGGGDDDLIGEDVNVFEAGTAAASASELAGKASHLRFGEGSDDRLYGDEGRDRLFGGVGGDTLDGAEGPDRLVGGLGDDTMHGGDDEDYIYDLLLAPRLSSQEGLLDHNKIYGGGGRDSIFAVGSEAHHCGPVRGHIMTFRLGAQLYGDDGSDSLSADTLGSSTLDGGPGDDGLSAGLADDHLTGGPGDDVLNARGGSDSLVGGDGDDTLDGGDGLDVLHGNRGNDTLNAGAIASVIGRGRPTDALYGEQGADKLTGGPLNDLLSGGSSRDVLSGGDGPDALHGGPDPDQLNGGTGQDDLYGDDHDDVLVGGDGSDLVFGGDGSDAEYGNAGDDQMHGGAGNDSMTADAGNDLMFGDSGKDTLLGGEGNDAEYGNDGSDWIEGNEGRNHYDGGPGHDYCEIHPGVDSRTGCDDVTAQPFVTPMNRLDNNDQRREP